MTTSPVALPVPEQVIEREIDWCVQAARTSSTTLWVACYFAYRVVGVYQTDATAEIARRAGRSPSSVENWAHAFEMYAELRRFGSSSEVRALRKALSPSHFWRAWEKQRKFSLSNASVIRYLRQMVDYKQNEENYSEATLAQEIEAHENNSGNVPTWASYHSKRFASMLKTALSLPDVPRAVRIKIMDLLEELEKRNNDTKNL